MRQVEIQKQAPELTFQPHFTSDEKPAMVDHDSYKEIPYKSDNPAIPEYRVILANPVKRPRKNPFNIAVYRSDNCFASGTLIPFIEIAATTDNEGTITGLENISPLQVNYVDPGDKRTIYTFQYSKDTNKDHVVLNQVKKISYDEHGKQVSEVCPKPDSQVRGYSLFKEGLNKFDPPDVVKWKPTVGQFVNGIYEVKGEKKPCCAESLYEMPLIVGNPRFI
jgi:hypothetical protein